MFLHNLLNVLVQVANKMGLQKKTETFTSVGMGNGIHSAFPIWEGLRQCNDLSPNLINVALKILEGSEKTTKN
jgi:hypothetical protein